MKGKLKQAVKLLGHLLVLIALVFLVKKVVDMDVDFAQFLQPRMLAALGIAYVVQTVIIVISTYPWLVFTRSLSGKKIPFGKAMPVFTRSNLYKYVPGNVFQYIGRNQLAADMHISHVDVACATILDILCCVASAGLLAVIFLGSAIGALLAAYWKTFLVIGCLGLALLTLLVILLATKFRQKCRDYLARYAKALEKGNRPQLLRGILYYLFHNLLFSALYATTLMLVFGGIADISTLLRLTGAFHFAWIVGFITPGAPGGIGIRESVMLMMCGAAYEQEVLLFVLVLRIGSIFADLTAFLIGTIAMNAAKNRKV